MRNDGLVCGIIMLLLICAARAFPLGASHTVGRPLHFNKGPEGLAEIVDTKNRVHGFFVNWNDWFHYAGDTKTFNAVLKKYAKLKDTPHILVIHEEGGMTGGLGDPPDTPFDWEIDIWLRWGCPSFPTDPNDPGTTQVVLIQLYLGDSAGVEPGVKLDDVKAPVAIHVEAANPETASVATNAFIARHRARQAASRRSKPKGPDAEPPIIMINCVKPGQKIVLKPRHQNIEMTIAGAAGNGRAVLGFSTYQWLLPSDEPPEKLRAEPKYRSAKPIYFAAHYGDAKGNPHTLVIDETGGTGSGYDVLYVDADNDNRIDAVKERREFRLGASELDTASVPVAIEVSVGGKTVPYHFRFSAFPVEDPEDDAPQIQALARDGSYYSGEAIIDGKPRRIAVADLNANGRFDDREGALFSGDRFFVDLDGDGTFARSASGAESFPCAEYTWIAGEWYWIRPSADGRRVGLTRAEPSMATLRVPEHAATVQLKSDSPKREFELDVNKGGGGAPAGLYRVADLRFEARDGEGKVWGMEGRSGKAVSFRVAEGGAAQIVAGAPYRIEVEPSRSKEAGSIDFTLKFTGTAGGYYRPTSIKSERASAKLEIQDNEGKIIAKGDFKPG